ncbi:hypothetical protein TRVL_05642 [Trypanosoma vivax]|nr:hypothetical protein TRVL_05642 [Trypanosoma vivax]
MCSFFCCRFDPFPLHLQSVTNLFAAVYISGLLFFSVLLFHCWCVLQLINRVPFLCLPVNQRPFHISLRRLGGRSSVSSSTSHILLLFTPCLVSVGSSDLVLPHRKAPRRRVHPWSLRPSFLQWSSFLWIGFAAPPCVSGACPPLCFFVLFTLRFL